MAKVTIVDGNDEVELSTAPKENIKAFMVKGEPGENAVSPTITSERDGKVTTLTITDKDGVKEADINDGFDPVVEVSKANRVTTIAITDFHGTAIAEIPDGIDLTGGVPTNGVIGFDVTELIYTCDGTETGDYYLTYENVDYYFTMPTVDDGDILVFNVDDLELSLDGTVITTSSTGTGTELTFIDNIPNGYEETDESLGGADIPQQATAPINPKENDLWIDTDEPGLTPVDSTVSTTSTNPVENQAITNYVNTKGITESGSNANGSYIKYDDGTMICYILKENLDCSSLNTDGTFYYKTFIDVLFPQTFISKPVVTASVNNRTAGRRLTLWALNYITTTQIGEITVSNYWNSTNATIDLCITAIGKWK